MSVRDQWNAQSGNRFEYLELEVAAALLGAIVP
jgi:hypothetical protein